MNLKSITDNRVVRLLKEAFADWMEDRALRLSAALAYYSVFSIAPLLIIAISVAGLVLGPDAVKGQLDEQLSSYIGPKAAETVQSMVQSAAKPSEGWIGAVVGFATLLLGASGVFGQLKDALNTIWEVEAKPGAGVMGFIRARLLNFGMVLVIGFLLMVSLLMSTALASVSGYFGNAAGLSVVLGGIFGTLVSLSVVTLLFAFIFKMLPDAQIEWRNVWTGALVTAVLFELGKFGLGFYLGREGTSSTYGAAGSVVLLLLWVYYASCILLFGAEFTQVYARDKGHAIKPAPGAVAVTEEARAQQGMTPAEDRGKDADKDKSPRGIELPPRQRPLPPVQRAEAGPLTTLLAVTAASFVVGVIVRRRTASLGEPVSRIRGGFSDLGTQATENLTDLLHRVSDAVRKR